MLLRGAWRGTLGIMEVGNSISTLFMCQENRELLEANCGRAVIKSSHPNMNPGDLDSTQA